MQLPNAIAALPWLRRLWHVLPVPLRVPLLLVGAVVWLYRRKQEGQAGDEHTTA